MLVVPAKEARPMHRFIGIERIALGQWHHRKKPSKPESLHPIHEYQVRVSASRIRENVREAIRAVRRTPRPSNIEAKLAELESVLVIDLYDKEKIDSVIDQAWELFKELKLPQTS
jgi:hypothetical protein